MKKSPWLWLENPGKRCGAVSVISFALAFLIPYLGWIPLLLLWTVNSCLSFKENRGRRIRYVHGAVGLLCCLLAIANLVSMIL